MSAASPRREPAGTRAAHEDRRASRMLALGAAAGVAAGLATALAGDGSARGTLPAGAIALVDGRPVLEADYDRALELLAGDKRDALTDRDRVRVLDRLIDEELLLQHGLASGLTDSDRGVRDTVLRAMVESAVADGTSRAPGEDELRALYREERERLQASGAEPPPFEAVQAELETLWAARARSEALRAYVARLRARARIEYPQGAAR